MLNTLPSLHMAYLMLFVMHALRHRRQRSFRNALPFVALFAAHIVVPTLLLRWHDGVDVLSGLLRAVGAHQAAVDLARREEPRASQPVWEPVWQRCQIHRNLSGSTANTRPS